MLKHAYGRENLDLGARYFSPEICEKGTGLFLKFLKIFKKRFGVSDSSGFKIWTGDQT